jgi:hypothetical protein
MSMPLRYTPTVAAHLALMTRFTIASTPSSTTPSS